MLQICSKRYTERYHERSVKKTFVIKQFNPKHQFADKRCLGCAYRKQNWETSKTQSFQPEHQAELSAS